MIFNNLTRLIKDLSSLKKDFYTISKELENKIFAISNTDLKNIISEIGIIPENIKHDSTEEKLFSKATDIVLAKTFQELGLNSSVNKERANCADVVAKSKLHNYTLVADAKAFRLSRTAKNQKDFKVKSMFDWKGDNDFAVLVCPYFQYPKTNSQIYAQALDNNICLLSWEHLLLFLDNSIKENNKINLSKIWNISNELSKKVTVNNKYKNTNFCDNGNKKICIYLNIQIDKEKEIFNNCKKIIISRGNKEIKYWNKEIDKIKKYTKEKAIKELLKALKIEEKIRVITKFISSLTDK